ncbi:MAG: hypothetical protein KDA66_19980, partial [Planctomycetaceae bacterium]|nr:hypothetical protein [Planctomycetaceae bacterium]
RRGMCTSMRKFIPAILIAGLLNVSVTAQELSHNSELVASIEEQIEGQVWLRKSEIDSALVSHVTMGSFAPKGSLQLLKKLPPVTELFASIDIDDVEHLAALHELRRRIYLHCENDEGTPSLPVLPNLEYLDISTSCTDASPLIESVSRLPRLRHLTIHGSGQDASYGIKDKDLIWLESATLESLRTWNSLGVNDESEWLNTGAGGSISDAARLKLLNVYREILGEPKEGGIYKRVLPNDSSETILEHLTEFVEIHVETEDPETDKWAPLVSLNFTDCQISETHLKVIAPLRKLQELRLNGTPIGDAELEILKTYDFLKILDLTDTNVTPNGVEAIRQSLPSTKVIYEARQK